MLWEQGLESNLGPEQVPIWEIPKNLNTIFICKDSTPGPEMWKMAVRFGSRETLLS